MSATGGEFLSEGSLKDILGTLSIPIFALDLDGRVACWNGRAGQFGYSDREVAGKLLVDFVDDGSRTDIARLIAQACEGSDQASPALLVAKDGRRLEVFFNITPWRGDGGAVRGCVLFSHFVAEQANGSMHPLHQDPLERLFETAGMPVFCIDRAGRVTIWNRKLAELTGHSKEHAHGQPLVRNLVTEESAEDIQKLLGDALETCTLKVVLLTRSGKRVDRLFSVTAIRDAAANICGALGVGLGIAELDGTARDTALVSDDLARVMDSANAMVFGIDRDGRVTEWNQKVASISGCERQHALGMPFVETFISPVHHKEVETALNMVLLGYDNTEFVFHLVRKDDQKCEILVNATVRRGAAGEVTGVIGVGQDITQLRQTSEDHRRLAEEWEQFIETANAPLFGVDLEGHVNEWNTNIATLTGYSKEEALDRPFVQEFIPDAHQARVQDVLSDAGGGWERTNFEVPLQTKHGAHIDVVINTTTRRNGAGETVGVFGLGNDITGLKATVRKMTRDAYNLSRLIETANALIFGVDLSGRVDEWNSKTADLTGYPKEAALSRPLVQDFIAAEHRGVVEQLLKDACNGKEVVNFEFPFATKSGRQIQVLLNATTRRDETGAVVGVLGVGQDITEFRAALTDRSSIVDDLTRFIDTANAPILGIDTNGRVTEWNQKAAAISGHGKAEALGKMFIDSFISEDFKQEVGDVLSKALRGSDTANLTFPLFTKDGYRREISLNATARRGANGEITGVIGVGQDVTELNQISAQNHRMASDWQRLIETANAPIFGVDIYGNVNEWNAKVAEVTGYLKTEVVRRPLVQNFIAKDHQDRVQNVLTAARNGRETANFEFPLATRAGKQIDILFNATPRRDEKGVVVGVFGVGQDITNLRSALTESKCIADDLTRLIDTANAPIFGIDTKGSVNEWNQKATEISGWGKKEAFGKVFVETFISQGFRRQVSEVLTRALAGSDTANFTFPLFAKEGRRREISLNATARRGADGEIIGVIGVGQDITDYEQSRLEQKRMADYYQRLMDNANAPIFGVNIDGKVTEWNRKAAEVTGFSLEESSGRHLVNEFISEPYQEKVQGVLEQACQGHDTANFEFPLITKVGSQVDILLNATARRDAGGNTIGAIMVGQDITGLRQVMNEAKFIADDLHRLIDTANAPIFGVDTEGTINEWNQKMANVTGFAKAEVIGTPFVAEFIMWQQKSEVQRVLTFALAGTETANYEIPIRTKSEQTRYILLNATTRRGSSGEITGVIGVGQDFTELKDLMDENSRIADVWMRTFDSANVPIFGVNLDLEITTWNRKAAELLGYSKEEACGMNLVDHFVDEQYKKTVHDALTLACEGSDTSDLEVALVTKARKHVYILFNATPRRDASEKIEGAFSIGQDVTELRKSTTQTKAFADDLARVIDSANAPIFGIDTRGLVTEWNHMFYKISGFEKQGVLGKPMIQTFIHVDQQDAVQEVFKRAMSGEDIANFEFQLYTNNGQVRDLSINATPRIGYHGEISGVVGVGQDVTEVNAHRKELERVAGNLRCTVDYANAPIIGVNVQCLVNEFNFKAAQLSGFSKEEILGKSLVNTLVSPDKRPSVSFALLRALGGQESSVLEFPLTTKDGDQRELTMNFTALRGATGDMEGVICVGTDITEMRQMAAQQKFIAEDFQRVIRSANAPIIGVNIHGQVNEWNDKAAELSGYSKEEALGKELVETFIRSEYKPEVTVAIRNACRGIDASQVEFPLIARDGSQVLLSLNAASRTDQWGSIIGMVRVGQDITNLHQAMDEIAASRDEVTAVAEDLRRTIDHANAPILGIDTQGRVTEWNQKMAEVTEFGKEEMLGKPLIEDFIMKEYQEQVGRVLKQAMDGTETDNYEFSIVSKSGSRREILLNAATRRGPEGKVTGVISIGQDITKIKAVTAHMERVAEDLSRLIETANAPIFAVSKEFKVTEWNRKCEEILGYSKADAMGQHLVRKFIHEVNRKYVRSVLNRALANDEVKNFDLTFYTREGAQRDVLLSATPRWGQENEINGVVCVGQDVTDMKKHRDNAERVADDYSRLINTANAPIFGVDEVACVTEWNNWVAVKSGFTKDETQGRKLTNYIAEKSQGVWLDVLRDASKGNPTETFEVELAPKDPDNQKCVSLLLNATPRIDPQGDIIGVICVGQDITSIREMEQRKAAFMAVVSHELRSPLNGIMGLSSGLVENAEEGSNLHKQLRLINNCASRLLDMVNNIMDAGSLVQDRKMRLSCENVILEKIVEEVVVLCQNSADRHGKKLVKEGVELINEVTELPVITADPYRCTQLVYNLVTNALKFTAKGHVRVFATADQVAKTVIITVEDTGIGIASEKLERIFQPFEQEDQSSTRHFEGLGLGLSICREVAIKHGGTLTVDSEKGKGSQFHVTFPFEMNPLAVAGQERTVADEAVVAAPPAAVQRRLSIPTDPAIEDLDVSVGDRSEAGWSDSEENSEGNSAHGTADGRLKNAELMCASLDDLQPRLTDKSPMVLSVDDEQVAQRSLALWFEMNGIKFVRVSSADSCLEHFKSSQDVPDLVLLEDLMHADKNGLDTLTDIRKLYNMFEVPVIIVSSRKSTNAVVKGMGRMCNDWVHKPFDRRELLARVKSALQMKEMVRERLSQCASSDKLMEIPAAPLEAPAAPVDRSRQKIQVNERELHELQRKVGKARAEKATLAGSLSEARRTLANLRQEQLRVEQSLESARAEAQKQAERAPWA